MPIFWNKVDKRIQTFGIEITPLLSIGNSSVGVFLPDVRFHDASELEYIVQVCGLTLIIRFLIFLFDVVWE